MTYMPTIGDIYRKGAKHVEVIAVTPQHVRYMIHPGVGEVSVSPAKFERLAGKTLLGGAVLEKKGECDGMSGNAMSDPAFD